MRKCGGGNGGGSGGRGQEFAKLDWEVSALLTVEYVGVARGSSGRDNSLLFPPTFLDIDMVASEEVIIFLFMFYDRGRGRGRGGGRGGGDIRKRKRRRRKQKIVL